MFYAFVYVIANLLVAFFVRNILSETFNEAFEDAVDKGELPRNSRSFCVFLLLLIISVSLIPWMLADYFLVVKDRFKK
jgi:Na+/H+ antiporter NhaC